MNQKILIALVIFLVLFLGCVETAQREYSQASGESRQKCIQKCTNTYESCKTSCDSYWLPSDKNSCQSKCSSEYANCKLDC